MTRTDELTEARAIIAALERCELRSDGDRRFLETWRSYLERIGEDVAIGKLRLQMLKRLAAAYGIGQADKPRAVLDYLN